MSEYTKALYNLHRAAKGKKPLKANKRESELHAVMAVLVKDAEASLKTAKRNGVDADDIHTLICHALADKFSLWAPAEHDKNDTMYPLWLSRVVAGVMQDNP
jgi:hypothetical protein